MVDNVGGTGTAVLVFNEQLDQISLRGTWEAMFPDVSANERGTASATALGDTSFVIYLMPAVQPSCGSITIPGVIGVVANVSGNRLTGEYVSPRCGAVKSGSLDLTRQ
jgi:hypothetical protein